MEIILIKDVDNLGAANEVVKVRNVYARNFLIPQLFAVEASPSNMKQLEEKRKQLKKKEDQMLAAINEVIAKLKEGALKLGAKTGTSAASPRRVSVPAPPEIVSFPSPPYRVSFPITLVIVMVSLPAPPL